MFVVNIAGNSYLLGKTEMRHNAKPLYLIILVQNTKNSNVGFRSIYYRLCEKYGKSTNANGKIRYLKNSFLHEKYVITVFITNH